MMAPMKDPNAPPSLFQALTEHISSKDPVVRHEKLELLLGILGFFTLAAFVSAVVAELQGKTALWEAIVLVLFLVPTYLVYTRWKRGPAK